MELKFSESGIPFIEFDPTTKLVFVKLCKSAKSYRWVTVNSIKTTFSAKINLSTTERVDFVTDVFLNGFPKGFTGDDSHTFTKHKYTFLRKVLKKYVPEGGDYIPANSINDIGKDLEEYNEPKRRLKKEKKKRIRRRVIEVTDESIAALKAKKEAEEKKAEEKERKEKEKVDNKRKKEIEKLEKELNGNGKKKKRSKRLKTPKPTKKVETPDPAKVEMSKICRSCKRKLFETPSCNSLMLVGHNKRWMPIVHKGSEPCKACGVAPGGRHHLHCPYEECPRCHKMIRYCGCFK